MLKFRLSYFIPAVILFVTEVCIAKFLDGGFIRNSVGDFLVVILLYCLLRSFFNLSILSTALIVFIFSYAVEGLQYFKIVEKLGLQHSKLARIIIGTSFEWTDLLAYALGIVTVLLFEKTHKNVLAK